MMTCPEAKLLSRENVASHLQKFRLKLKAPEGAGDGGGGSGGKSGRIPGGGGLNAPRSARAPRGSSSPSFARAAVVLRPRKRQRAASKEGSRAHSALITTSSGLQLLDDLPYAPQLSSLPAYQQGSAAQEAAAAAEDPIPGLMIDIKEADLLYRDDTDRDDTELWSSF